MGMGPRMNRRVRRSGTSPVACAVPLSVAGRCYPRLELSFPELILNRTKKKMFACGYESHTHRTHMHKELTVYFAPTLRNPNVSVHVS